MKLSSKNYRKYSANGKQFSIRRKEGINCTYLEIRQDSNIYTNPDMDLDEMAALHAETEGTKIWRKL